MIELAGLLLVIAAGVTVVRWTKRQLLTDPDTLAEDVAAFAGMPLSADERRAVAAQIQYRRR